MHVYHDFLLAIGCHFCSTSAAYSIHSLQVHRDYKETSLWESLAPRSIFCALQTLRVLIYYFSTSISFPLFIMTPSRDTILSRLVDAWRTHWYQLLSLSLKYLLYSFGAFSHPLHIAQNLNISHIPFSLFFIRAICKVFFEVIWCWEEETSYVHDTACQMSSHFPTILVVQGPYDWVR